jgi:uroporphyrinogen-III synthase
MPAPKIEILSTRPVDAAQVKTALRRNIGIDVLSFIETTAIQDIETQQEIEWASTENAIVVFTSMNAVDAVVEMLDGFVPEWQIYCMGHTTKQLITEYFGEQSIAGVGDNASELADEILENEEPGSVIFFCGNRRREELPGKLKSNNIDVTEIIVYETTLIEHTIEKKYNGILFFSPSAAESFFRKNTLGESTIVFAIGDTTAKAVHKYCVNKIVTAIQPGKDELMQQAIDYFS